MKPFKLDNEPKIASGFKSPEGYFDSFENRILSQLPKEEPKVISLSRKSNWYYAAAAVAVLMLTIPVYNHFSVNEEELDAVALEDYIANHSSITTNDIATLLEKEDLEKMKLELNLQDEAIEDVLLNNIDVEQYITY